MYYLQAHAFVCATPRYWVILDSRSDKYLTVDRQLFDSLLPSLHGFAAVREPSNLTSSENSTETSALASALLERNILTTDGTLAKHSTAIAAPSAAAELEHQSARVALSTCLRYAPSFLAACWTADHLLQRESIDAIVRRVATRKLKHKRRCSFDRRTSEVLIHAFDRLRPWYPRDYLCLFDSLALIEFLAHYRQYPTWIFGVRSDPFYAHCWLQADALLLNDALETTSVYCPIMAV